jgi:molybdopterin molybdotransferase
VLGLPGNPASALVCAELFLRPLLAALTGADPGPA